MISGTIGLLSASTISRTSLSLRSRAPRIYSRATRLQFGDRLRTDHPAVSNQAHPSNAKALAQARDNRQQRLHIGGVARPGFRTDRPAFAIEDDPDDHLAQIGAMVLRLAMPTKALATGAVEQQRGGV